jgi:hypothetical protein
MRRVRLLVGLLALVACAFGLMTLTAPTASADPPGQFCGGFAGIPCPDGFMCVDVPGDGCNPNHGGADCAGYCKKAH